MRVRPIAIILLLLATSVHAQTRYITDRTIVELRRGPSTEYLILRNLEAGAAVQILEDAGAGYSRVRVQDQGTEGFILTRFLLAEPIARDKLAAAERSLAAAKTRATELEQQVSALTAELGGTKADLAQTRSSHNQASKDLADLRTAAANVVEIRDQNESLRQRLIQRDREVEELTAAKTRLTSQDRQNWFIVGAGVLFGGVVIGLIAPSLRRKRRSDW
ncbi:MAG: TIGR04211 family SH3 domain-containing protein [Gammaproteobacteria bacterium]